MLLPIGTSVQPRRTPWVNYGLIAVNVALFLVTFLPHKEIVGGQVVARALRPWARQFMLHPEQPFIWQFVSYAFLHGGPWHIVGNMYFLYIFGNNVNDRLGSVGYLGLYFSGAVFSALGHSVLSSNAVLGASGAVAAVTGAYLVFFPQSVITVLYFFFIIGTIEVSALFFIIFKLIIWDNILEPSLAPQAIAYGAHLAGYAFGIAAIILLLATGMLSRSHFDLWAMLKQWNRRRRYRDTVAEDDYDPFGRVRPPKRVRAEAAQTPKNEPDRRIESLRTEIARRLGEGNLAAAAGLYNDLMKIDSNQLLPRKQLLDIANQLASQGRAEQAAGAYEQFLGRYSNYEYIEQVQLMLGLLYARYLDRPKDAVGHLRAARDKLADPGQRKMCDRELARLQD